MTYVKNSVTGALVPEGAPGLGSAAVVIPAYKPGEPLVSLVETLCQTSFAAIVVVDDGSGPKFQARFAEVVRSPKVSVVGHAVNLGKGAALKTGMNVVLRDLPGVTSIVTADADGQHLPQDICRIAATAVAHPDELVLGAREFGRDVPLRSRFGNSFMRVLFRLLVGQRLSDTQTGLRGIPTTFAARLLRVTAIGYEFELNMLVLAKQLGIRMREVPISTVYLDGNASSHFHPVLDSMRIYFALLRSARSRS